MAREQGYSSDGSGHVASFPGHMEGARKWAENEATDVMVVDM